MTDAERLKIIQDRIPSIELREIYEARKLARMAKLFYAPTFLNKYLNQRGVNVREIDKLILGEIK